jgi:hypothetical protein
MAGVPTDAGAHAPARDFSALASPGIRGLASYDPGHDIVALRNKAGEEGLLELGGCVLEDQGERVRRIVARRAIDPRAESPEILGQTVALQLRDEGADAMLARMRERAGNSPS